MSETFERLAASIRQAGQIVRSEIEPSRTFEVEIDDLLRADISAHRKVWAVCVVDEDDSLVPRKIYEIEVSGGLSQVRVTDENGEALLCPGEWFVPINVPQVLSEQLAAVA
jgi:hypothetical protein